MLDSPSAHPFASLLLPLLKLRSAAIARKMVGVSPAEYAELWARLEELVELTLLLMPEGMNGSDRYVSFGRWSGTGAPKYPTLEGVPAVEDKGTKTIGTVKVEYRWNPGRWFAVATVPIGPELRKILEEDSGDFYRDAAELRTLAKDGETKEAAIAAALDELVNWIGGPVAENLGMVPVHGGELDAMPEEIEVKLSDLVVPDPTEVDDDLRNRVVKEWNALYPVGTRVRYSQPKPPGIWPEAPKVEATTRTPAEFLQFYPVLSGRPGKAVVWVSGCSIPIPLENVEVVTAWGKCPLSAPGGCRRRACWESGKCQAENVAVGGGEQ